MCATGCPHATIQAAIDTASAGDTLVICPGTYGRTGDNAVAVITRTLTIIGAGAGNDGTILDSVSAESTQPLVQIVDALDVELRGLRIQGEGHGVAHDEGRHLDAAPLRQVNERGRVEPPNQAAPAAGGEPRALPS
ncbi:MAG: hypothetical protein U0075_10725 [Thermomicrobiales bacterium]